MNKPPLKTIPAKPEYAFDGDLVLVEADEQGENPRAVAVLSPHYKRRLIPGDESTSSSQADWLGLEAKLKGGILVFYCDAVLWDGVWYVQYSEIEK